MHTKVHLRLLVYMSSYLLKMILGLWRPKQTNAIASAISNGKGKRYAPIEIDTDEDEEDEDEDIRIVEPEAAGWLYVGSHNFTPSAWYASCAWIWLGETNVPTGVLFQTRLPRLLLFLT